MEKIYKINKRGGWKKFKINKRERSEYVGEKTLMCVKISQKE